MALEVSAAIIGILAAAGKVAETLGPIVHSAVEAPKHARAIHTEVRHSRTILLGLQALFGELAVLSSRRKQLIQIDQLVAALTDGVLFFSELEALLGGMGDPAGALLNRMKWARKAKELDAIVQRLYGFKTSIALMLSILRCESDLEARADREKLVMNTSQILASNLDLGQRLANLEGHVAGPHSVTTTRPVSRATASIWATDTIRSDIHTLQSRRPGDTTWNFPFEIELKTSRVYQRVRRRDSTDYSFCSSVPRSHAWTALSDISLSDISAISVIALPLYSTDITNAYHYGYTDLASDGVDTHPEVWSHTNGHSRGPQPEDLQVQPPNPSQDASLRSAPYLDVELAESSHAAISGLARYRWVPNLKRPMRPETRAPDFHSRGEDVTTDSSDTGVYYPMGLRVLERENSVKTRWSSVSTSSDNNGKNCDDDYGIGISIERDDAERYEGSDDGCYIIDRGMVLPSPTIPPGH